MRDGDEAVDGVGVAISMSLAESSSIALVTWVFEKTSDDSYAAGPRRTLDLLFIYFFKYIIYMIIF